MVSQNAVAALILAGGAGARLQTGKNAQEKWALELKNKTLLDHVCDRVAPQVHETYFCVSPNTKLPEDITPEQRINDPSATRRGPLPALLAGLQHLVRAESPPHIRFGLSVAVDTPFFPTDFIERVAALSDHPTQPIVGCFGAQPYPTCALWPLGVVEALKAHLNNDSKGSIFGFLRTIGYNQLDYSTTSSIDPFFNINTMDDLKHAETLASQTGFGEK